MLKKIFVTLLSLVILIILVDFYRENHQTPILGTFSESQSYSPTPKPASGLSLDYKGREIGINWFEVEPSKLVLIPNFTKRLTAKEAKEANGCKSLVNAGFYSKDISPIGLFINDDGQMQSWQANRLFNGVLSINHLDVPRITSSQPRDILRIGLQSGPVLIENAQPRTIAFGNSLMDRRVIAFTTGENRLYFAVFYLKDLNFSGPILSDMPDLLMDFEEKAGVEIADAINLDGGTASSFYSSDVSLSEINFSGSFFCEVQ